MDIQHYLNINEDNFALNLGEDFYYYQKGNKNILIHLATQQEFHDIDNIIKDQPLSLQLNKLINHIPTINIDQHLIDNTNTLYPNQLIIKYNNSLLYWESIFIHIPKHIKEHLRIILNSGFTKSSEAHIHPIVQFGVHLSPNFKYIYKNKLYVNK